MDLPIDPIDVVAAQRPRTEILVDLRYMPETVRSVNSIIDDNDDQWCRPALFPGIGRDRHSCRWSRTSITQRSTRPTSAPTAHAIAGTGAPMANRIPVTRRRRPHRSTRAPGADVTRCRDARRFRRPCVAATRAAHIHLSQSRRRAAWCSRNQEKPGSIVANLRR